MSLLPSDDEDEDYRRAIAASLEEAAAGAGSGGAGPSQLPANPEPVDDSETEVRERDLDSDEEFAHARPQGDSESDMNVSEEEEEETPPPRAARARGTKRKGPPAATNSEQVPLPTMELPSRGWENASERPVFGAPDGAWERENQRDVEEILEYMRSVRAEVYKREKANNKAYDTLSWPKWRLRPGSTTLLKTARQYGYKSVLHFNQASSDNAFVPYTDLDKAAQLEAEVQLLGCTDDEDHGSSGDLTGFLCWSNNETRTFEYVMEHVEALLRRVPLYGGSYRSTAAQRLSEAIKGSSLPVEVKIAIRKHRSLYPPGSDAATINNSQEKVYCLALCAHEHVELFFNKDPTGAGKTSSTIKQAMKGIVRDDAWAESVRVCELQGRVGVRMEHLGLRELPPPGAAEDAGLARVAIALVPEALMGQWEATAMAVSDVFKQEFGKGFHVWCGSGCVARKSKKVAGIKRVLSVAHKLTRQTNQALFWILKAETHSSKIALRDAPNLAVWYRIYDEMTGSQGTEPRNTWEAQSTCVHNVIVNATIKQLERQTTYQPNHPLRLALRHQNLSLAYPKHAAIITLCSSPAWLRRMQGVFIAPNMPSGIQKIALRVKVQSLAGKVQNSDMMITTTEALVESMLRSGGSGGMGFNERKEIVERCTAMLSYDEGGATIRDKLTSAVETAKSDLAAVPENADPNSVPPAERQPILNSNNDLQRTRSAYATMIRLFERLLEAVCGDPRPECPITLEPIPIEFTCILPCCSGMIDKRVVGNITNGKCPLCRKALGALLRVLQAVRAIQGTPEEPKPDEAAAALPSKPVVGVGDAQALIAAYKEKAGLSCKSSLEAVTAALELALQWKPRGLRVLLCCNISSYSDFDRERSQETRRFIRESVAGIESVEVIQKHTTHLEDYKADTDANRVLLINTSRGSNSLAGLDLGNTDLVLFDNMTQRGSISASTVVQAIGRAMRPQKGTEEQARRNKAHFKAHGVSNWAPKLVLTINRYTEPPPAPPAPEPAPEPAQQQLVED